MLSSLLSQEVCVTHTSSLYIWQDVLASQVSLGRWMNWACCIIVIVVHHLTHLRNATRATRHLFNLFLQIVHARLVLCDMFAASGWSNLPFGVLQKTIPIPSSWTKSYPKRRMARECLEFRHMHKSSVAVKSQKTPIYAFEHLRCTIPTEGSSSTAWVATKTRLIRASDMQDPRRGFIRQLQECISSSSTSRISKIASVVQPHLKQQL